MTIDAAMHRRAFLRSAALGAAVLALPWRAAAQQAINVIPVDENSALFTGAGANVFATRSDDGIILVDTGLAERADDLRRAVAEHFGDDRIAAAFNTHWHYDATGGNAMVIRSGGRVFAHEYTRQWLDGDFWSVWEDRVYKPQPREFQPTDTFYADGSVTIGGREIVYRHMPAAHTEGDLAISFPDADILLVGGLAASGAYPILDYTTGGWIGGMARASERLTEMAGEGTKVIAEQGPILNLAHLQAQTDMLNTVRERAYGMVRRALSAEEMMAEGLTAEFDAQWGDPKLFVTNMYPGLFGHSGEIGGIIF